MNPQDQQADHSRQQPENQQGQTADQPDAAPQIPSLPSPVVSQSGGPAAAQVQQTQQPSDNLYRPNDTPPHPARPSPANIQMHTDGQEVVWTAAEFIDHDKSPAWYLGLVGISVVVIAAVYFITKDIFNSAIVAVAAVLFAVVAGRQPRHMQYVVNDHGIGIGHRFYAYADFRSFSVLDEGHIRSIVLMPLKRFMPPLNLYYDPADENRIGDLLATHLPFAEHQRELTDRLMRRIRF